MIHYSTKREHNCISPPRQTDTMGNPCPLFSTLYQSKLLVKFCHCLIFLFSFEGLISRYQFGKYFFSKTYIPFSYIRYFLIQLFHEYLHN
jgi:hypothetical protein